MRREGDQHRQHGRCSAQEPDDQLNAGPDDARQLREDPCGQPLHCLDARLNDLRHLRHEALQEVPQEHEARDIEVCVPVNEALDQTRSEHCRRVAKGRSIVLQSGHQASHKTACRRDELRTVAHDLFQTVSQYRAQLLCHALEASGFECIRKAIELLRAVLHHIPERSLELFVDLDPGILRCGSERGQVSLQVIQLRVPHRFQCAVRVLQLLRESFPLDHAFFVRGVEAHHQVVQSIHVRLAADGRESRVPLLFCTPCQGRVQLR